MREVWVTGFGKPPDLLIAEVEQPRVEADELLVQVAAAGVNFPDLLVTEGTYQNLPDLPFVPGKELAGVVLDVGPGVTHVHRGSRVSAQVEHGAFAEVVRVPASHAVAVPDGVTMEQAAALGMGFLTAHYALVRRAAVQPGEHVLVTGANGDVGRATVQLASWLGAHPIAHVRGPVHVHSLEALGAEHIVVGPPESLRDQVLDLTGGRGAQIVVENVGGEVFRQAFRCTAWEGRLVVVGFASGVVPDVSAGHVLVKNLSIFGLQTSDYRDDHPTEFRTVYEQLLELLERGQIDIPIENRFGLHDVGAALEAVRTGDRHGKIVIDLDPRQ